MKKNILTVGIITFLSVLLFSPGTRNAINKTINTDTFDKMHEMKNVLADFKRNN